MINKFQGETLTKEVEVVNPDGTPADLTGCMVTAGIGRDGETVRRIIPTIIGNVVSVLYEDTASLKGQYELEIKLKTTDNLIKTISMDRVFIYTSYISEFVE